MEVICFQKLSQDQRLTQQFSDGSHIPIAFNADRG